MSCLTHDRRRGAQVAAVLFLVAMRTAQAQPAATSASPPRRAHHALVYDASVGRVLLTGGSSPRADGSCCDMFNDTWSFDGRRWSPLGASAIGMSGMRLYLDAAGTVRSFGGFDGQAIAAFRALRDTAWVAEPVPPALAVTEPGVAFDGRRQRLVVHGGSTAVGATLMEHWEFDGRVWSRRDIALPSARQAHAMTFDARRGVVVLFGGAVPAPRGQRPSSLGDLWEFDGTSWRDVRTTGGPSPRHSSGVAWDARRGRTIVFGGVGPDGLLGDTWGWDGAKWTRLADTGPAPRAMGYLAYDAMRDRVVLFGGRLGWPNDAADTWEFDGTSWARIIP